MELKPSGRIVRIGAGRSGPYSEPVRWASTIGNIQKSGRNKVIAPGATLTATTFIIVFHEDQPRFANWSVDFHVLVI